MTAIEAGAKLPAEDGPIDQEAAVWAAQLTGYFQGYRDSSRAYMPIRHMEPVVVEATIRILRRVAHQHLNPDGR